MVTLITLPRSNCCSICCRDTDASAEHVFICLVETVRLLWHLFQRETVSDASAEHVFICLVETAVASVAERDSDASVEHVFIWL